MQLNLVAEVIQSALLAVAENWFNFFVHYANLYYQQLAAFYNYFYDVLFLFLLLLLNEKTIKNGNTNRYSAIQTL